MHSQKKSWHSWLLISLAAAFLLVMLVLPLLLVATEALRKGWGAYAAALTEPFAVRALYLTLEAAVLAIVGNTLFGLASAWLLTKYDFRGKAWLGALIDLPFAISPVVAGLFFIMLFGRMSPLYPFLRAEHLMIVFAVPGIILATIFVTLPFITRELVPVMEAQGRSEEEAAATMGAGGWTIFRRVTLPNIRWALLYGVVLTNARAIGEFGAVSVVSGSIRGETLSLPLQIELLEQDYNTVGSFTAAALLTLMAILTLFLKSMLQWRLANQEKRAQLEGNHEH